MAREVKKGGHVVSHVEKYKGVLADEEWMIPEGHALHTRRRPPGKIVTTSSRQI